MVSLYNKISVRTCVPKQPKYFHKLKFFLLDFLNFQTKLNFEKKLKDLLEQRCLGACTNHVDSFLDFFDPLPLHGQFY